MNHSPRLRLAALAACAAGASLFATGLSVPPAAASMVGAFEDDAPDSLLFKTGKEVKGKVLEETDTQVRFLVVSFGISAERWFEKADILKVVRGHPTNDGAMPAVAETVAAKADPIVTGDAGATRVYMMELSGEFGRDISQTPIRDAVKDARKHNADIIVVTVNNDWYTDFTQWEEKADEEGSFDELFRAEDIDPVLSNEIQADWNEQPKVVFWVKKAMGGASFLPLISPHIYFHSDGKLGGIGNLFTMFGSTGDEVVRQKQYSLRLGHAKGMAGKGGHDSRIVQAMCEVEYVLSYKIVGGQALLLERMPESPDEILLTDDGQDERQDTIQELARERGNDVLTLNAERAYTLGISSGTVDNEAELMRELGIDRNYTIIDGRAESIMKGWNHGVDDAIRNFRRLWQENAELQPQGDYRERTRIRGQKKSIIKKIQSLLRRYGEVLDPRGQFISELNILIEQIDNDQQRDWQQEKERRRDNGPP